MKKLTRSTWKQWPEDLKRRFITLYLSYPQLYDYRRVDYSHRRQKRFCIIKNIAQEMKMNPLEVQKLITRIRAEYRYDRAKEGERRLENVSLAFQLMESTLRPLERPRRRKRVAAKAATAAAVNNNKPRVVKEEEEEGEENSMCRTYVVDEVEDRHSDEKLILINNKCELDVVHCVHRTFQSLPVFAHEAVGQLLQNLVTSIDGLYNNQVGSIATGSIKRSPINDNTMTLAPTSPIDFDRISWTFSEQEDQSFTIFDYTSEQFYK